MNHEVTSGKAKMPGSVFITVAFACLVFLAAEPAFAQGGLEKVNTFVENVLLVLDGVSIGVVTVAIMWAGYKFLFKHADIAECGKILAGGLLIGGASELASYLLA
jgi:type IV secretion system protein VirB2/type IV secretion system protein PtlA